MLKIQRNRRTLQRRPTLFIYLFWWRPTLFLNLQIWTSSIRCFLHRNDQVQIFGQFCLGFKYATDPMNVHSKRNKYVHLHKRSCLKDQKKLVLNCLHLSDSQSNLCNWLPVDYLQQTGIQPSEQKDCLTPFWTCYIALNYLLYVVFQ